MEKDLYLDEKKCLAHEAATQVTSGMTLGLGSGSTAREFIFALANKIQKESLEIYAVASSQNSYSLAKHLAIPLLNPEEFSTLDLAIDGADEVDPRLRMIKGGGGAIFREKILLKAAKRSIILVDESKLVPILGKFRVPLEISRFGRSAIIEEIRHLGYEGVWRLQANGDLFITDSGNYIYDIYSPNLYPNPEEDLLRLIQIHGVIEVGFVIEKVEVWSSNSQGLISKKYSV
ncbi:ribose 5-phosphate isomerase A [Candidatus Chlamydia corallus]|uniref:ribose 5-phosphate isomerase A n=1 Tax=Candidatus Chlamydia corallus TaxID=2038470 RepID=UPI000C2F9802|nr:ribose 5-phosphate isomerase A [Candidatus Chlamydia corallus]